mmetsp:Transcript_110007/g.306556  ORF Transcript_110007/g.306556 Transcript_110007/m.306556 type:complete len:208 (-) Transcript_110007:710-1333(-)
MRRALQTSVASRRCLARGGRDLLEQPCGRLEAQLQSLQRGSWGQRPCLIHRVTKRPLRDNLCGGRCNVLAARSLGRPPKCHLAAQYGSSVVQQLCLCKLQGAKCRRQWVSWACASCTPRHRGRARHGQPDARGALRRCGGSAGPWCRLWSGRGKRKLVVIVEERLPHAPRWRWLARGHRIRRDVVLSSHVAQARRRCLGAAPHKGPR